MPVFDSLELVKAYKEHGQLPKIHAEMLRAFQDFVKPGASVIDLGSSVGLLPAGLMDMGAKEVICIEGNCPQEGTILKPGMIWQAYYLTPENLNLFSTALDLFKPTVCTARRVFSEIDHHGKVMAEVIEILHEKGVKQLILQGRVPVDHPQVRLWNTDLELEAVAKFYKPKVRRGPVCYLEAV